MTQKEITKSSLEEKCVLDAMGKTSLIISYGFQKTGKSYTLKGMAELIEIP